jgi:hypothetical protein
MAQKPLPHSSAAEFQIFRLITRNAEIKKLETATCNPQEKASPFTHGCALGRASSDRDTTGFDTGATFPGVEGSSREDACGMRCRLAEVLR